MEIELIRSSPIAKWSVSAYDTHLRRLTTPNWERLIETADKPSMLEHWWRGGPSFTGVTHQNTHHHISAAIQTELCAQFLQNGVFTSFQNQKNTKNNSWQLLPMPASESCPGCHDNKVRCTCHLCGRYTVG